MVCLGFEAGVTKWQAQTKPWNYGGRPLDIIFNMRLFSNK